MTEFNQLKPIIVAVSLLSTLSFASSAAVRHHHTYNHNHYDQAKSVAFNDAVLDQNQGGIVAGALNRPDWVKRINVSGLVNVDAIYQSRTPILQVYNNDDEYSNINPFGIGKKASDIGLSDANLFVDAKVNHWVNAHVALQYRDDNKLQALRQYRKGNNYDPKDLDSYYNNTPYTTSEGDSYYDFIVETYSDTEKLRIDEAYFTLGNLEKNPFYLRAGRLYVPFGQYQRYAITDTLTQLLSQTSETAIEVGKVFDNGLSAAAYALRGTPRGHGYSNYNYTYDLPNGRVNIRNWGAQLTYAQAQRAFMYDVGVGYLHNMADVDYIHNGLGNLQGYYTIIPSAIKNTPAVSIHANARMDEFDAGFRYVSALEKFDAIDVPFGTHGAKPRAMTFDVGYGFDMKKYHSRLGLTYQTSQEAKNIGPIWLGLPLHRYGAELQMNIMNRTDLVFSLMRDKDYSTGKGGTGKNLNVGMARLSVAFA